MAIYPVVVEIFHSTMTTNHSLIVALDEKAVNHQSYEDSSSKYYENLYQCYICTKLKGNPSSCCWIMDQNARPTNDQRAPLPSLELHQIKNSPHCARFA